MLLGLTVGSCEVVLYVLTVFALLTDGPMICQEEAELERCFGKEYLAYKRAVPAVLIPCLSRLARGDNAENRELTKYFRRVASE